MLAKRLIVLVTVAGVAAVACHSGGAKTSLGSIELAADRTTKAGTSRIAITARVTGGGISSGPITETGTGVADYERNVASLQLTISGAGAGPQAIGFRIVGPILYEKLPPGAIPGSKPWIKIDLSGVTGSQGGSSGPAAFTGNPAQTLQYLKGASNSVTDEGEDTIRGTKTKHYRLTVDLRKAADRMPEQQRATFLQALKYFGSTTLPMDVWVDDQGRVRRMSLSMEMKLGTQGTAKIEETVDLFDFGVPVKVSPPPSSEITDIARRSDAHLHHVLRHNLHRGTRGARRIRSLRREASPLLKGGSAHHGGAGEAEEESGADRAFQRQRHS